MDLENGNQKEKEKQLLRLYNLHITEFASKRIQHNKENKEKQETEHRVDSMLEKRGLRKDGCQFLKDSPSDVLVPLAIAIPLLVVENPNVPDSLDHYVKEGCLAMNRK